MTVDEFVEQNGGSGFLELPRVAELVELARNLEVIAWAAVENNTHTMDEIKEISDTRWVTDILQQELAAKIRLYDTKMADLDRLIAQSAAIRTASLEAKHRKDIYTLSMIIQGKAA